MTINTLVALELLYQLVNFTVDIEYSEVESLDFQVHIYDYKNQNNYNSYDVLNLLGCFLSLIKLLVQRLVIFIKYFRIIDESGCIGKSK